MLITKRKSTGLKNFNDAEAFVESSNNMDGIYKTIEEFNPNKTRKILIICDDMIADMFDNKKINTTIVMELLIRGTFILFLLHNLILLYQKILD